MRRDEFLLAHNTECGRIERLLSAAVPERLTPGSGPPGGVPHGAEPLVRGGGRPLAGDLNGEVAQRLGGSCAIFLVAFCIALPERRRRRGD
jgi:hypothetical protein